MRSVFGNLSSVLRRASSVRPLTAGAGTGFVVMAAGDAASQLLVSPPGTKVNLQRNLTSATYNGMVSPAFYMWYRTMDRMIPGTTARTLVPKVLLSQIVTTGLNNPFFLAWCHHIEAWVDGGFAQDWSIVRSNTAAHALRALPNIYGSSMLFWLPVTTASYALVPDHLRVLWVSSCSVLWGGFVSHVAHRGHDELRRRLE